VIFWQTGPRKDGDEDRRHEQDQRHGTEVDPAGVAPGRVLGLWGTGVSGLA
jgi:hypothetical protein